MTNLAGDKNEMPTPRSTSAASTSLRLAGYAWQAIVMRMEKFKNMFLMSKAKRALRSSNKRSGAYHMRLKTS